MTRLNFPMSYFCRQPMPDRYKTWFSQQMIGYITSAVTPAYIFAFALGTPVFPFNLTTSGPGNKFPNSIGGTNATSMAAGLDNLLYRSASGTGIYLNGLVWSVEVEIVLSPQGNGDNSYLVVAPLATSLNTGYSNFDTMAAGPNSQQITCVAGVRNTLKRVYKLSSIAGLSDTAYAAQYGTSSFSGAANPGTIILLQVFQQTTDNANLSASCPIEINLKWHVELFNRADTALLDT